METKQTAVEWLEDKIINYNFNQGMAQMRKYILQAKAMEKEQIIEAAHHGVDYENSPFENAEQYYNETYGTPSQID